MTDILRTLYDSDPCTKDVETEEFRALRREEIELLKKLAPQIGLDVIDEIDNTRAKATNEALFLWFRKGFRLGASLMLELL